MERQTNFSPIVVYVRAILYLRTFSSGVLKVYQLALFRSAEQKDEIQEVPARHNC
jgi:hypothetical protein